MNTIQLQPKIYKPGDITLQSGNLYVGIPDQTILQFPSGLNGYAHSINGDDFGAHGITFTGGGIWLTKGSGRNTNIDIDNCVFNLQATGAQQCAVTFNSGLSKSKITNSRFTGYQGAFGLYGYGYDDLTIANNEFDSISAAMHLDAFGGCGQLLVEQNYCRRLRGMFMEFQTQGGTQPAASGVTIQDNYNEDPDIDGTPIDPVTHTRKNIMGISAPFDRGANIAIRRNTIISTYRPDGVGMVIGIECGGGTGTADATVVEQNLIVGTNDWLAMNDGNGPAYVIAQNNRVSGQLKGPSVANPASNRLLQLTNNGAGVVLNWDTSRGRPHRNHRYGSGTTPTPPPIVKTHDIAVFSDGSIQVA